MGVGEHDMESVGRCRRRDDCWITGNNAHNVRWQSLRISIVMGVDPMDFEREIGRDLDDGAPDMAGAIYEERSFRLG